MFYFVFYLCFFFISAYSASSTTYIMLGYSSFHMKVMSMMVAMMAISSATHKQSTTATKFIDGHNVRAELKTH